MQQDSLDEVIAQCWQQLGRGGADAKDPFHTPTLITLGQDGFPAARTVILRKTIRPERVLVCHSDWRATKIAELQADARITWHLWHPKLRVQLRLHGEATLHHQDEVAQAEWTNTSPGSRLNYGATRPPGEAVASLAEALSAHTTYNQLDQVDTEAWWPHFCVIRSHIHTLEYLLLAQDGHRRARFTWQEGRWQGQWLVA